MWIIEHIGTDQGVGTDCGLVTESYIYTVLYMLYVGIILKLSFHEVVIIILKEASFLTVFEMYL